MNFSHCIKFYIKNIFLLRDFKIFVFYIIKLFSFMPGQKRAERRLCRKKRKENENHLKSGGFVIFRFFKREMIFFIKLKAKMI